MASPNTSKRTTTDKQYEIMLDYVVCNHRMLSRKFDLEFNRVDKADHWLKLTELLNEEDPTNGRETDIWRKVWSDWKNRVNGKVKRLGTRGLSSPLETKLYDFIKNLQEDDSVATTSEGISASSTIKNEQESRRSSDISSDYSDKNMNLDDLEGDISKDSQEAEQKSQTPFARRRTNWDELAECSITDELRKMREQIKRDDERKIKVLQKLVDEQEKIQLTLLQMGNTLKKMLAVQEELPKALRD